MCLAWSETPEDTFCHVAAHMYPIIRLDKELVVMREEQKQLDSKWKPEYEKDVVYLHVISRSMAGSIVNLSPFALKLETWLRINKIPFEVI